MLKIDTKIPIPVKLKASYYTLIPKDHYLAGQRRKVRCKCTEGVGAFDYEKQHEVTAYFFSVGKFAANCPACRKAYFYVD